MPRNRASSRPSFNTNLLEPDVLVTPGGLQTVLDLIKAACSLDDSSITEAIVGLDSRPHVLEYILSVLDDKTYERLSKWIINQFPATATLNVMDALDIKLLQRLSSSFTTLDGVPTVENRDELREFRRKSDLSLDVLKELGGCIDRASVGVNVSPTSRKRPKARARHIQLDPHPFDRMGIAVPMTEDEARVVCDDVLSQLRHILGRYLLVLRQLRVSDIFKHQLRGLGATLVSSESIVQLIRADLYPENANGLGEWRIFLSEKAQKYLRKVGRDGAMFDIVMKKIEEISHGHFSRDNQKKLTGTKTIIPIYEAKMTGDTRLVYHIDCMPDGEGETQAIRVFGIYTHAQMNHGRFWNTLSKQLENKGPDYISRCSFRNEPLNTRDNVISPATFTQSSVQVQETTSVVKARHKELKKFHSMLVLEKPVILSQALFNSILANWDNPHLFAISAQEQEVVENMTSCYVIGRSGTGKTTTILYKMLSIEHAWKQVGDKIRQIFVTTSRFLATKVEEDFLRFMLSLEATSHSPEELRMMGVNTKKKMEFIDLDDIEEWRPDLPSKFSELIDDNFPLFITYDQLCLMLQNDIGEDNDNDGFIIPITSGAGNSATGPPPQRSHTRRAQMSFLTGQGGKQPITYDHFQSHYWHHFPQSLTKDLDPALVFSEILGNIKGSEEAIGRKQRCLDRDTYLSSNSRGISSNTKKVIYDLFIAYTRIKQQDQEYDAADRAHHILKEFCDAGWKEDKKGRRANFLYVDEVQDNLLIDSLVLRASCNNPNGLLWAGDTAQTISIGSSFNFSDLKAFQYHIESDHYHGEKLADPKTYELIVNYRSHGGIVNCARSVVEQMMLHWPHTIDALQPERASVDGPLPMFFSNQGNSDLERSFFGDVQGKPVQYGHDQWILVRDNKAREQLRERFKGRGIIMTVNECKGLEVDEVLLYNFFEDSTANANQWRLVLRGISDRTCNVPVPDFDETKHANICTELKFLYVAITRARKKLWFLDSSKSAEPMKAYWDSKQQIEIWEPPSKVPCFAKKSSSKDWDNTGQLMFAHKHYAQAMVAFQHAGKPQEVAISYAYLLRESARVMPDNQVTERADAFTKAGEAFSTCANGSQPHQRKERLVYHTNAAECFLQGHKFKEAGSSFVHAEKYSKAAYAYQEGGYFDEMIEVLGEHVEQVEAPLLTQLRKFIIMNYFKHGKIKEAQKLFSSEEEAIAFAVDYGFDEVHVELLRVSGKVLESAEVLAKGGRIADAIKALIATPRAPGCARRAVEYLSTGLWKYQSFGVDPPTTDPEAVSELLTLGDTLRNDMHQAEAREFEMFKARHKGDFQTLGVLHPKLAKEGNLPAALLCLDPIFLSTLPIQGAPTVDPAPALSLHLSYFELLGHLRREDSLDTGYIRQKIFAFQLRQDDRFFIPANSFLHAILLPNPGIVHEVDGCVVTHEELRRTLDRGIPEFIYERARQQNSAYRRRLGASPCLMMLAKGECWKEDCQSLHFRPENITAEWFNARIRSILMEIRILNLAGFQSKGVILHWICTLYSTLHPPLPKLGSIATLDLGSTPESVEGIRILQEWIWQACDRLLFSTPPPQLEYIETFIPEFMATCTMAYDFDFERAQIYIPRTRMYGREKWPACLTRPGLRIEGQFIVRDFVGFLWGGGRDSLILGAVFLGQVLINGIPVEVGSFCDAVERLCGSFIAAYRFTTGHGSLHNVTLPRSWLIGLFRSLQTLDKNTSYMPRFLNDMIDLLRRLDLQRENCNLQAADTHQFKHNGLSLSPMYASMYMARICFCLCLFGYNVNNRQLQHKILQAIHRLRRAERVNSMYRQYAEALNWQGLVDVFTKSLSDSTLDEMILLLHSKAQKFQGRVPRFVRTVKYENIKDIPDRLTETTLRIDTRASADPPLEPGNYDGQEHPGLSEEDSNGDGAPVDHGGQEEVPSSPEEIRAVRKIEAVYRRSMIRKKEAINPTITRLWSLLYVRASSMEWQRHKLYKLLMQGPLVHVLVCLDGIKMFADRINRDSKERLKGDDHRKLEELIDRSDRSSNLRRAAAELQTRLGHSSPLHEHRSVPALKSAVLEVGRLIDRLSEFPIAAAVETKKWIEEDWKLGWDGIIKEPVRALRMQRPKLTLGGSL